VARYAQRLPEAPERLYFTWHHPELNEVALFGVQLSTSRWAYRIYCWTEDEARAHGRVNPNQWPAQNFHTSGVVHFAPQTR
jgi:hypothetical protein